MGVWIIYFTFLICSSSLKIQEVSRNSEVNEGLPAPPSQVWARYFNDVEDRAEVGLKGGRRRRRRREADPAVITHMVWTVFEATYDRGFTMGVKVTFDEGPITLSVAQGGMGCGTPYLVVQNSNAGESSWSTVTTPEGLSATGRGPYHLSPDVTKSTLSSLTFVLEVPASSENLAIDDELRVVGNAIELNSGQILSGGDDVDTDNAVSILTTRKLVSDVLCLHDTGTSGSESSLLPCQCVHTGTSAVTMCTGGANTPESPGNGAICDEPSGACSVTR